MNSRWLRFCFKVIFILFGLNKVYSQPIIIAHRGGIEKYPENTVEAIVNAAKQGIHVVEFDLRFTADSQIVILHDPSLATTTNVESIYGRDTTVSSLTLAQVKQLKIDRGPGWSSILPDTNKIPTLVEMLEALRMYNCKLILDLKITTKQMRDRVREILHDLKFDSTRIILNNFYKTVEPPPLKMVTQITNNIPQPTFSHKGITLDGSFGLTFTDTTIYWAEDYFNLKFTVDNIDSSIAGDQMLLQMFSNYDIDKVLLNLVYKKPSTLSFTLNDNGSYQNKKVILQKFKNLSFQIEETYYSISFYVNNVLAFSMQKNKQTAFFKKVRFLIGMDRYATKYLYSNVSDVTFVNYKSDTLKFPLRSSLFDTKNNIMIGLLNYSHCGCDLVGLPIADYSRERTDWYSSLGLDVYVWTINDKNRYHEITLDPNVKGIYTDYPISFTAVDYIKENRIDDIYFCSAYPNPFNLSTNVIFFSRSEINIKIEVFDEIGRKIYREDNFMTHPGKNIFRWNKNSSNRTSLPSGVYFLILTSNYKTLAQKLILLK